MNRSSKLDEIDFKLEKLMEMQDFTTCQTAFLAILFSLFIFSVTAIIINYNPILTLISILMVFVESGLLIGTLISIFSGDWESKLAGFSLAIWLTIYIPIYLLLSYLLVTIRFWLFDSFEVGNVDIVILLFLTFALSTSLNIFIIDPRYHKRFKLLFEQPKRPVKYQILISIDQFLLKWVRKIGLSFILSIFVTIATGIIPASEGFGFPLYWLFKTEHNIWDIDIQNFIINVIFFTIILFILFSVFKYFRKDRIKEKITSKWEDTQYFIKTKQR